MPPPPELQPRWRRAFTLTEMLVVMGVILILVTMLLAGAVATRKAARQTMCLTQLHSISLAVSNYGTRFDGAIPLGSWADIGPGGGMPAESPMSVRGFGTVPGDVSMVYGPGARPLPTIRDALSGFMNTKERVWKCPLQLDAKGPVVLPFIGSGWSDDERGFRPGYRFMSTVEMRAYIRSTDSAVVELGKRLRAGEMLVRNIGGVKINRIKTLDRAGHSTIVLAYDASPAFHSKEPREMFEIPLGEGPEMRMNVLYLDGHAEEKQFRGRDGFMELFHGPVKQKWYGAEFDADNQDYFVHPARKEGV